MLVTRGDGGDCWGMSLGFLGSVFSLVSCSNTGPLDGLLEGDTGLGSLLGPGHAA